MTKYKYSSYDGRRTTANRAIYQKAHGNLFRNQSLVVHHINGDRYDNRLSNLALMTGSAHLRLHWGWKTVRGKTYKRCSECGVMTPLDGFYQWASVKVRPRKSGAVWTKKYLAIDSQCKPCARVLSLRQQKIRKEAKHAKTG